MLKATFALLGICVFFAGPAVAQGETVGDDGNTYKIDNYTLVDAAVSWVRGPLRVTLSGRNLFNSDYYFDGNSESADPGPPRQILLSTTIR